MAVAAYQQPPAGGATQPRVIEVEKLRDNLFVLRGGGGNTAVFVQESGVTVVDSKNPGWGQTLIDKIREITNKPVTTIINTHSHFDHVSGNVDFPATVDIVTHQNTADNMRNVRPVSSIAQAPENVFATSQGRGLPKRTFSDRLTLGTGNDRVELHYFGRGHTNGDAWVLFPAARVLHAGDIFSGKNLPLLDFNNGGSGVAIPDTLAKAHTATAKLADQIITGHSAVMVPNDLREYADFNRDFLGAMREAKKAGRSADEVIASWKMPDRYAGYAAPQPARLRSNVEGIYKEIP
jgi:glyoxylase-like metal-dependent hydrolase (beta-lactamase superfamily II)